MVAVRLCWYRVSRWRWWHASLAQKIWKSIHNM